MDEKAINTLKDIPGAAVFLIEKITELNEKSTTKNQINCVAVYGKMGVGKTTLIKEVCRQLGVCGVVNSPSFAIINEYHTSTDDTIYHFDFYRINQAEEVFDLGYEDYFYGNNLCFIEWPEKISDLLPEEHVKIQIKEKTDNTRIMTINKECK